MMNLFELNVEFREAIKRMEFFAQENDGEISSALEEELNGLKLAREQKVLNLAGYIKEIEAESSAIKAQEKLLADRRRALEAKAERLTDWLKTNLEEGEKLSCPWAAIGWRKSQAVQIVAEKLIPKLYFRTVKELLKQEIKDALKAGKEIPGATLETRFNLVIK